MVGESDTVVACEGSVCGLMNFGENLTGKVPVLSWEVIVTGP